ncbi:MAG: type II toxin-antitoxin system HicA family toxin [Rikenellaceae bacterium]
MKYSELLRLLKQDKWYVVSQQGSHIKMRHPEKGRTLIVPDHGAKEVGKGLAAKLLRQAGLIK